MSVFNALIVEDEFLARLSLKDKLKDFPEIEIIGEAKNISEAKNILGKSRIDVIFLDIQLKDETGFDLLNQVDYEGKIIFVTAYDEYAVRAFEINALDYIMKPISKERLGNAIKRISVKITHPDTDVLEKFYIDDRIMVQYKHSVKFIKISEIVLISSAQDYTQVLTGERKKYLVYRTMNEWDNRLPEKVFCRIHRSYIINLDYIEHTQKLSSNTAVIYLKGIENPFKVSRIYYQRMKEKYLK